MSATYIPIQSTTLTTSTASVTFSNIPQTYTDLVLRGSSRVSFSQADVDFFITVNSISTSYSNTAIYFFSGSVISGRNIWGGSGWYAGRNPGSTATSNTFGSFELYIPNYSGSTNKPAGYFSVSENNSTTDWQIYSTANLLSNTAAISSITINSDGRNFVSGSSFHLYGISNA